MEQGNTAVQNVINLVGMMCFWSGLFNIFEKTNAINSLSKGINKIIGGLFNKRDVNDKAIEYMSLNVTTNILGVGNASTVNGIRAIEEMQKLNYNKEKPNNNMTTFVVLNTASIQVIPTSMIAMRAMYGSTDPAGILIPVWIISILALTSGLITIKILNKLVE
ncbi:Spore maturation protein A [compost metagenome]